MSIGRIFIRGLALAARQRRLAVRLWAANLLFSVLVVFPLAFLLHGQLAHSLSAGSALKRPDLLWLTDLSMRYREAFPMIAGMLPAAVIAYLLLSVFLNGGVIGSLDRPGARTTLAEFFHDCGRYFWPFLRLFLLSIPCYLLVAGALHGMISALLDSLGRRAATEWPVLVLDNLRLLFLVLLLGLVSMFFDYVKIGLVRGGRRRALRESWATLKFIARRFFRAWGLYLLAGLAFVLLSLAYLETARVLPAGRPLLVLLAFLWQQGYVLGRQFSRILFFATEVELFNEHGHRTSVGSG